MPQCHHVTMLHCHNVTMLQLYSGSTQLAPPPTWHLNMFHLHSVQCCTVVTTPFGLLANPPSCPVSNPHGFSYSWTVQWVDTLFCSIRSGTHLSDAHALAHPFNVHMHWMCTYICTCIGTLAHCSIYIFSVTPLSSPALRFHLGMSVFKLKSFEKTNIFQMFLYSILSRTTSSTIWPVSKVRSSR